MTFDQSPNFEAPTDNDGNNLYSVTVNVGDGQGGVSDNSVTITVTNVEEPGTVGLSSGQPEEGTELAATITDPDGDVTSVTWIWETSPDQAAWTVIDVPTSNSYSLVWRTTWGATCV